MGQAVGYWTGQSDGRSWWRGGAGQGVAARRRPLCWGRGLELHRHLCLDVCDLED